MIDANKRYQLKTEGDRLIFTTSSFRAEKTSVLHSGVYTREFSSMLLASAFCIAAYMLIIYISIYSLILRYLILISIFVITFLLSRKTIFKEKYIEVIFNKPEQTTIISRSGIIKMKREIIPFFDIKSVEMGSRKFIPENIDGINFVRKISLQHGNAVPGLGDIEEFITLSLRLNDGSERIIYAGKINGGKIDGEPSIPVNEIKSFLNK